MKLAVVAIMLCLFATAVRADDRSDVYEALLPDRKGGIYVARTTTNQWISQYPRNFVESYPRFDTSGIPVELVARLYEQNAVQHIIEWKPRRKDVRFLPEAFASSASQDGLKRCLVSEGQSNVNYRRRQGDGSYGYYRAYYAFSLPAFSKSGNEALVMVELHCAPMSGGGEQLVFLRKKGGKWVQVSLLLFAFS